MAKKSSRVVWEPALFEAGFDPDHINSDFFGPTQLKGK